MDKLYIVIPAYNEEENMEQLINDWYPVIEKCSGGGDSRLVIVNDGSKDRTYEMLLQYAQDRPLLCPLTKENGGHGSTLLYGYQYAIDHGADYVFQTDSDGQTNPAEFEQFWENRKEYVALFGSRPNRQDGAARKFVEETLKRILFLFFGVRVPDANAPFRLMKIGFLKKYIKKIPKDYNLPNVMLTTYGAYFNEKIKFFDISFKPRQGGVNSINKTRIIKIGWNALGDFWKLKRNLNEE